MPSPTISELPPPPPDKTGWPWTEACPPLPELMPDGQPWPRISIATPSYNQGAFLEETIRSVLLQGYPDVEYVVIDGGSQDGSLEVIRKYAPWLAYWVSEKDRGQSHAINKGWERLAGDLIAYINSDDYYLPGAFQRAAALWAQDPSVAVIAGGVLFIDETGEQLQDRQPFLRSASPLDLSLLKPGDWYIPQQSSFFSGPIMERVGRCVREPLHYTMDRELMYRLCRQGRVALLDEPLAADRRHSGSKRIAYTLKLYQEDALAMRYCDWGTPQDAGRRRWVARQRLAQGYSYAAKSAPSRWEALRQLALAAYYRPAYLHSRGFYKDLRRLIVAGPEES